MDLAAAQGETVIASACGRIRVARDRYLGLFVEIDHGNGYFSRYAHLATAGVVTGEPVVQGAPLGTLGATGRVTGPHLHWSVTYRGASVDPLALREFVVAYPLR